MTDLRFLHWVIGYLLAVVAAQALFAAAPGLDLATARLFAEGATGFPWAEGTANTLSMLLRRASEATVVLLVVLVTLAALMRIVTGDALRAWAYIPLGAVLGSGVIVNLVLKSNVGRARPVHLAEFGGEADFTPAWQVTSECLRNCSFTSGEVALATGLAVPLLVLLWPRLTTARRRYLALGMTICYVGGVALLRVGLGRHFLSDAVFSMLISIGVTLALYPVLRIGSARAAFGLRGPMRTIAESVQKRRARQAAARSRSP